MRFSVAFRALAGVIALAGWLTLSPAYSWAADDDDDDYIAAEDRLPPSVLLFVTSPDLVSSYEKFQTTAAGQLIQDPSLEKFRAQLVERYEEFRKEAEEKLELPIADLVSLFAGEASLAVLKPVGQPLGWVSLLEIGEHEETLNALLKRAEDSAGDDTKIELENEEIEGTKVITCTISKAGAGSEAQQFSVTYFVKDGMFVVASDSGVAEEVLVRWDGEHEETFGGNEIYQEIVSKCSSGDDADPSLIYYLDPVSLLASGLSMAPQTQNFAGMIYMPPLGLTGLKAFGGVHELATEKYDHISRTMVFLEGPPSGIVKIFQLKKNPLVTPAWVPEDAGQFITFEWDIKGAYEAIESLVDSFAGPGTFAMQTAGLLQQVDPSLKLKPDVIDVLNGKFTGYITPNKENPAETTGVLSIGITDAAKAQKLVDTVWKLAGGSKSSTVEGTKLYEPEQDDTPGASAIKNNAIFVSNNSDLVKKALAAKPTAPLSGNKDFKTVLKDVPKEVYMFSYQNPTAQFGDAYEKARAGEFDGLVEGKLDFSVLPPFETLKKYITPTAGYYIPDEHGTIGVQFNLKPASK